MGRAGGQGSRRCRCWRRWAAGRATCCSPCRARRGDLVRRCGAVRVDAGPAAERASPPRRTPSAGSWISRSSSGIPRPARMCRRIIRSPLRTPRISASWRGIPVAAGRCTTMPCTTGTNSGSGSIRITDPAVQGLIFRLLGVPEPEQRRRFGFLLDGLAAGAPPHGGFALGFDRIAMLLAGGHLVAGRDRVPQDHRRAGAVRRRPDDGRTRRDLDRSAPEE